MFINLMTEVDGKLIQADIETILNVARQAIDIKYPVGIPFTTPSQVKQYLTNKLAGKEAECFAVMFLNAQNELIEYSEMFNGTTLACPVYPKEIARKALLLNAVSVILSHNHPSGKAEPSPADISITEKVKKALDLFEIKTLDHIIVAGNASYSFLEMGNL